MWLDIPTCTPRGEPTGRKLVNTDTLGGIWKSATPGAPLALVSPDGEAVSYTPVSFDEIKFFFAAPTVA